MAPRTLCPLALAACLAASARAGVVPDAPKASQPPPVPPYLSFRLEDYLAETVEPTLLQPWPDLPMPCLPQAGCRLDPADTVRTLSNAAPPEGWDQVTLPEPPAQSERHPAEYGLRLVAAAVVVGYALARRSNG
jgi:hypothetical protein